MRTLPCLLAIASFAWISLATAAEAPTAVTAVTAPATPALAPVMVSMDTTQGRILLQLDPEHSPKSVANFLEYVKSGFYEGLIFHRVIPGFMVQGGGYDGQYQHREGRPPIRNEAGNGLYNLRGTIAMARTDMPHSATSEFYINLVDNYKLDPGPQGWGYAVFGSVVEGMDTVRKIAAIPTASGGPFPTDVPLETVVITKVSVVDVPPVQPASPAAPAVDAAPTPTP